MKKLLIAALGAALAAPVPSAMAADEIKIGFMTTLSGPGSSPGIDQRDAFNLAVKTLGGKLGGIKAEVVIVDDQFSPDAAKQAADAAIDPYGALLQGGGVPDRAAGPAGPAGTAGEGEAEPVRPVERVF